MSQVRALSLWGLWAALINWEEKQWETRDWSTSYRGLVVIHASLHKPTWDDVRREDRVLFTETMYGHGLKSINDSPRGVALCVARIEGCVRTERIASTLSRKERAFGNYDYGRWAWKLTNIVPFAEPVECKGQLSLWDWMGPLPEGVAV